MLDEAEQVGAGRRHRPAHVVLGQPVELPDDRVAIVLQIAVQMRLVVGHRVNITPPCDRGFESQRCSTRDISAATACAWSPRSARSPAITPSWSASERFWLSFALPSTRSTTTLDADDRAQLTLDVLVGGVGHCPRMLAGVLVFVGQLGDRLPNPVRVVVHRHPSGQMHRGVVPCRHDLAVLLFARVPGRRDVGVGARADQQHRRVGRDRAPVLVRPGHVGDHPFAVPQHRQQRGSRVPVGPDRDELRRRDGGDEATHLGLVVHSVEVRYVHGVTASARDRATRRARRSRGRSSRPWSS